MHREAKLLHLRVADLINIAFACDDEDPDNTYDYLGVLEEIQDIHDNLKKMTVEIPDWLAKKVPRV
jgi:hypothetical protein